MCSSGRFFLILVCVCILALAFSPTYAGVTTRISVASDGTQGNGAGASPSISADGRYVAFDSGASNLVPGDTNKYGDVFVHDQHSGLTTRVSVASDGTQVTGSSYEPSISADGRYVAFMSSATNLVPGDTNRYVDVFVHDRQTGVTERVSVASDGMQGNYGSYEPSISADGRYVAFESSASNLVPGDTNGGYHGEDIFVHDRQTGLTTRVSVASEGTQGNERSYEPSISADGRYVAFVSDASNLVPGDTDWKGDVFVRDRQTGQTTRVSVSSNGTQGNYESYLPSISADGRYVAFVSKASNLVPGDTNAYRDVFVHDRQTGQTARVSVASDGTQGNWDSYSRSISADGRYVAFQSYASNLVPSDTNGTWDVFVRDRQTGQTSRVPISSDGTQGNYESYVPSISADGRYVAFDSNASNLVPGDTNVYRDVFVRDRWGLVRTKAQSDGIGATLSGNTATCTLPGLFYVEDADRSAGIKVLWGNSITEGDRYHVDGTLATDDNGERYINAWNVRRIDSLPLSPVGLNNRAVGGGPFDPGTGGGQVGIFGALGLNNIGLLIRTWGRVTQFGEGYLYIDDGSGLKDGTSTGVEENVGVRVICDPAGYSSGEKIEVTGISSCFWTPSGIARRILTRKPEDLRKLTGP